MSKKLKKNFKVNFLMNVAGGILVNKLNKASKNCEKSQEKTLRAILEYAKDTEWGKAHNYSTILKAKDAVELQKLWEENQPAIQYEDIRPFVERHKNGEENILFPGKPMMYATTSGTTKEPKWIPITNEYYKNIYSKMSKVWLWTFIHHRPKVFGGMVTSIVGKSVEGAAPDGTVYGSVSGVTRRDCPEFIHCLYCEPDEMYSIADYKTRYYCIMRTGIEKNVTLLVTANPSTIVEMQNNVNEFFDDYVTDIEKGTLKADLKLDPEIRKALEARYAPNPERANELRALKEKYGKVLPKHYWPDMQVLTTWKCGNTKVYLEKFKDSFPENMLHQEFGYFASECRAGLVMNGKSDTVLFPHMHYFEFVPEEDLDKENKRFLRLCELEKGKRYSIFVTTFAGLYRYDMNDLIEVTGFYGTIPTIQLVQKINGIISMTGEKIHERQFIEAVHLAEAETGIKTKFFVGFADLENSVYDFYYEFENVDLPEEDMKKFNSVVDKKLKEMNIEYLTKRDSLRVKDPIPFALQKESFETYKERCILAGARDGQFKLNLLMQDEKRHAMFKELVRK